MSLCPAATVAGAIFTALIVLDIYNKNYKDIFFHIVTGILAVLGLFTMCSYTGDSGGWALLAIPFLVLIIGFYIQWAETQKPSQPVQQQEQQDSCCDNCGQCPCGCQTKWPTDCEGAPLPKAPLASSSSNIVTKASPASASSNTFGCPKK